ncbi:MAG: FHA domain-containing protein, partial [Candidatus Phosphoribacter sp.]
PPFAPSPPLAPAPSPDRTQDPTRAPDLDNTAVSPSSPAGSPAPPPAPAEPALPSRIHPKDRPWLDIDGERYPLLGSLTVIGRDPSADVIIDDPGISRRHSEVRVTVDGPHLVSSIRDLASTNGTFVNGERITGSRLRDGDQLTVGRTPIVFHAGRR